MDELLRQHESKTLDFKRDLSSPRGVLKNLVAFANSAGGRVVLGVDDDRQVIGVDDPLATEERICNLIADSIQPRLVPTVELVTVEDKTLLIVEVFPSSFRPHFLKAMGPEKGVFIRLGSTNRQAGSDVSVHSKAFLPYDCNNDRSGWSAKASFHRRGVRRATSRAGCWPTRCSTSTR